MDRGELLRRASVVLPGLLGSRSAACEARLLRAVTSLLRVEPSPDDTRAAIAALNGIPLPVLQRYLSRHQVGPLCHEAIWRLDLGPAMAPPVAELLQRESRLEIARSLLSEDRLSKLASVLDDADVTWLTFKGAHLSQILYAEPHFRPFCDIDVLVSPQESDRAARALCKTGMRLTAESPHEATYVGLDGSCVDLHTSIFRRGRSRGDLTRRLLERRVRLGAAWVPDDTATFVILTIHPALTDYVTGRLIRAVDLDRFLRLRQPDDAQAMAIVEENGLSAAAWATLAWTRAWLRSPATRTSVPPAVQRAYLMAWLAIDPNWVYRLSPTWLGWGSASPCTTTSQM